MWETTRMRMSQEWDRLENVLIQIEKSSLEKKSRGKKRVIWNTKIPCASRRIWLSLVEGAKQGAEMMTVFDVFCLLCVSLDFVRERKRAGVPPAVWSLVCDVNLSDLEWPFYIIALLRFPEKSFSISKDLHYLIL